MKPMIINYSYTMNNEKLALRVKDSLGCEIYKIKELKKRRTISILLDFLFNRSTRVSDDPYSVKKNEVLILISPIWGGRIASPMRAFVEKEKNSIHKYLFISLCNGIEEQKEKIAAELTNIIQKEPIAVTELWINRLLPEDKQNKIKHTFHYKVSDKDFGLFENDLKEFIGIVNRTCD